jgi:cell division protein FtsA
MVLTGGSSALPGIANIASTVLGMPVRTAKPDNLRGLVEKLDSPAYSTSVGLLHWAVAMHDHEIAVKGGNRRRRSRGDTSMNLDSVKNWLKRLLP